MTDSKNRRPDGPTATRNKNGTRPPIRVMLCDPDPLSRRGLRSCLGLDDGLLLVAETDSWDRAQRELGIAAPDVFISGWLAPDAFDELLRRRILVVNVVDELRDEHFKPGAPGPFALIVRRELRIGDLPAIVRLVAAGHSVTSGAYVARAVAAVNAMASAKIQCRCGRQIAIAAAPGALESLTEREGQVLARVVSGQTNKEIAAALLISEGTVKIHVRALLRKFEVRKRLDLIALAVRKGWPGA